MFSRKTLLLAIPLIIFCFMQNCLAVKTIYVGTAWGLSIGTGTIEDLHFINKRISQGIGDIYVDSNDIIYAATPCGLLISNDGGDSFVTKTSQQGLGDDDVFSVYANNGIIYATTYHGLSISPDQGESFINYTEKDGLGSADVHGVFVDKNKTIYTAERNHDHSNDGGVSIRYAKESRFTNYKNGLGSVLVNRVFVDDNGTIYAATDNGLAISQDRGKHFSNKTKENNKLGGNLVTAVFVDKSGIIYATTSDVGGSNRAGLSISYDHGNSFTYVRLADNIISNVVGDNDGIIYIGTEMGLFITKDQGKHFIRKTTADGLADDFITGVIAK